MGSYRNLLSHIPSLSFDENGIVIYVNKIFLSFFNVRENEVLMLPFHSVSQSFDGGKSLCKIAREAYKSLLSLNRWEGTVKINEHICSVVATTIRCKDGELFEYGVVFYPNSYKIQSRSVDLEIVEALSENRFLIFLQPIVPNSKKIYPKFEALLRLSENGKILTPYHFLSEFKKASSYSLLVSHIILEVARIIEQYSVVVSINMSLSDVVGQQKFLMDTMREFPLLAQFLVIEILEDEFFGEENNKEIDEAIAFLHFLRENGVQIAIDDFGMKHSNWARFLSLEPDIIKIDGSLIKNIANNQYMFDIVQSLVEFAKKHNITTVAEYVENASVLEIVKRIGVDYSQGYHFGEPRVLEDIFYGKKTHTLCAS